MNSTLDINFYTNFNECKEVERRKKTQTNPRYKNFKQVIFTAGDEEQFLTIKNNYNKITNNNIISLNKNLFNDIVKHNFYEKYKNLNINDSKNTFKYIFYKLKKGIFVKIKNNKLEVFLPFSNANFNNEWSHKIKIDNKKYNSFYNFFEYLYKKQRYKFNKNYIKKNIKEWYGNNSLVRYENPTNEGDNNMLTLKNMFETLCENRKIPDMEFYLNRRDFPLLTNDETEPYNNIWGSKNIKLVSHNYSKYFPILSMSKTERYADLLIPTWDDWARVKSFNNIYFPHKCKQYTKNFDIKWKDKKNIAVFRGGTTGSGTTIETNMRLKVCKLAINNKLIDAGITKWNLRPRKSESDEFLNIIDHENLPFDIVKPLSPYEQSKYKYIIQIDGHVAAFRLSLELNMGSVILKQTSKWKLWYSDLIKPYVHYVPINNDLSNLEEMIIWCINNDNECKKIAENAKTFYNKYLSEEAILDYLQKLLVDTKKINGNYFYNSINPEIIQTQNQLEYLQNNKKYPKRDDKNIIYSIPNVIYYIPEVKYSYGLYKGIELMINKVGNNFFRVSKFHKQIFKNNSSEINLHSLANFNFISKTTNVNNKFKEQINETFLGKFCINNLCKIIPNFCYTFGLVIVNNMYSVISEFIDGITLQQYILSDKFNFNNYLDILLQLSLALQIAQDRIGFIHWDLTPWNIMIKQLSKKQTFYYKINHDKIYTITTNVVPIIIDYGKSHAIHENIHYGIVNPYKYSKIQDILSLLFNTLHIITNNKYNIDQKLILKLSEFITNTNYKKENFNSIYDLKLFLNYIKKYSTITTTNFQDLLNKNCIDFFKFVYNNFKNYVNVGKTNNYINILNKNNEIQVFDYIYSENLNNQVESYLEVFFRFKSCTLPQSNNLLFNYYIIQRFYEHLLDNTKNFETFCKINNINFKQFEQFYNGCLTFINKLYWNKILKLKNNEIKYEIIDNNLVEINSDIYNDIDEFIKKVKIKTNNNMNEYKYIIIDVLSNNSIYKLKENDKEKFLKMFNNLLNLDSFKHIFNVSNINTIKNIGKIIINKNMENNIYEKNIVEKYENILKIL